MEGKSAYAANPGREPRFASTCRETLTKRTRRRLSLQRPSPKEIFVPQKANLLIVDDEANTFASLARAFRLAGHEATVCDNAARALELAKSQHFDLILSDVVMPGKDGISLLEDLKAQEVSSPVVMMSGQAHIEMAVRATRLGAL